MAPNPFFYGAPVRGEHFFGREAELDALTSRMRDGVNVVVLSPRRYGKTSLILRAVDVLERRRPRAAVVSVNVLTCRDAPTLASRLVSGAYRVPGARWARAREGLGEFLRRIRVRPAVELDDSGRPRFSFAPSLAVADVDAVLTDVMGLLAEDTARPSVLVLDEFQAIGRLGDHLPALFKGLSDEHPGVCLVLAGSQHHLMERLVVSAGAPLYGMAQRLALEPIAADLWLPWLTTRSAAAGKAMSADAAAEVLALAGPVPNDVQHLAYEAWELAGRRVGVGEVGDAFERAVDHDSNLYAEIVTRLSPGQLRVLGALADGDTGPIFTGRFATNVGLASGQSVKKAIDALAEDETVVQRQGRWVVGDPFLAAWLRRRG